MFPNKEKALMRNVVLALTVVGVFTTAVPAAAQYYQEGQRSGPHFDGGPTYRDNDGPRYRYRGHYDSPHYGYPFG
jgi:hypothetical protein